MQNKVASFCAMGDIVRRAQSQVLPQLGTGQKMRRVASAAGPGRLDSVILPSREFRRCLCTNALTVVKAHAVVDALMIVKPPPAARSPGSTFLTHSQRRIGLKDPASDKYAATRAAKKSAIAAYVPSHPVPAKTRADAEDAEVALVCPGCGVFMQDEDPLKPGYFRVPIKNAAAQSEPKWRREHSLTMDELRMLEETFGTNEEQEKPKEEEKPREDSGYTYYEIGNDKELVEIENGEFSYPNHYTKEEVQALEGKWSKLTESEEAAEAKKKERNLLKSFKREKTPQEKAVVCARCFSLKHYGRIKEKTAENLLPGFDFEEMIGQRLKTAYGKRAVVLMVVDGTDFEGSFPRKIAKVLTEADEHLAASAKTKPNLFRNFDSSGNSTRFVVVATKVDLLPKAISPVRLEQWVRKRVILGGAPRPTAVHLVSSTKNWGIQALTERLVAMAGSHGDVWVVGAQNAGKSSLINALTRYNVGKDQCNLTEAAHPGTTIGVLKLNNILPKDIKLFDTPGILHSHQLILRLDEAESKLAQIRKELKPRTYRIKAGYSVHVGGLLRLDLVEAPAQTIYMTVFASQFITLHMGKTEKAVDILKEHIGNELRPPANLRSWLQTGKFVNQMIRINGDDWRSNSVDIAVAGLGWVGLGLKGEALINVWTFEGVAVSTREALAYDYARIFETPGFTFVFQGKKQKDKKPSNAETSFNRRKDRIAKEKAKAPAASKVPGWGDVSDSDPVSESDSDSESDDSDSDTDSELDEPMELW